MNGRHRAPILAAICILVAALLPSCTVSRYPATAPRGLPGKPFSEDADWQLQDISGMSGAEFVDMVERDTARFFIEAVHPESGLITDNGRISHVGSNGFGLIGICIAAERGWITREDAATRVLKILNTFLNTAANRDGMLWWITDAATATKNVYNGSYDVVETAYVIDGALVCKQYFDGDAEDERKIREYADALYARAEFDKFVKPERETGKLGLVWGYDPKKDALGSLLLVGYHEAQVVVITALGSPTHPAPDEVYEVWTNGYTWTEVQGEEYFFCPALFTHQYSPALLDLRKIQDAPTREKGITYFENSTRATRSHINYAKKNPGGYPGYGAIWGLTDCGCPLHEHHFGGHGMSPPWDIEDQRDDGTVAVSASGASIMFTPEESIACLRHIYGKFGERVYDRHGFKSAFNEKIDWFSKGHDALNKGAMLCAIENYRSGMVWGLFMRNPEIVRGLEKAGFTPIADPGTMEP